MKAKDASQLHGPLHGVRVLDLTWVLAGPYASMLLCDLGAETIKIERPPSGDPARTTPPFAGGESVFFASVNRGKKSVLIDLDTPDGRELLLRLVEKVDVLIENFTPGTMDAWGLGYDTLELRNPRLIYAAISGFGQTGPERLRPAYDVVVQAMSGAMSVTGDREGPPLKAGFSVGDIGAGLYAAAGILAALYERERSGRGQFVDVAMLDCQVALLENAFARYFATREPPQRIGTGHPTATPFQAYQTLDGYIVVALSFNVENAWAVFCALIGLPELIDDMRFAEAGARKQHESELNPLIATALGERMSAEWLEEFQAVGIACAPVLTVPEAAALPQLAAREMLVEVDDGQGGRVTVTGTPIKLSRTPAKVLGRAPRVGEHTDELSELLD